MNKMEEILEILRSVVEDRVVLDAEAEKRKVERRKKLRNLK